MTIEEYIAEARKHNPCDEGMVALEKCHTRKKAFELLASPVGCDYFLKSIQEGWGPSVSDFLDNFLPYINGALTVKNETKNRLVRSQVWSNSRLIEIDDDIRWLILIGCQGKVRIKPFQVVKIYVDINSNVEIEGSERSIIYIKNYGGRVFDPHKVCKIL